MKKTYNKNKLYTITNTKNYKKRASRVSAVDRVGYRLEHAKSYEAEAVNFEQYDETGAYIIPI